MNSGPWSVRIASGLPRKAHDPLEHAHDVAASHAVVKCDLDRLLGEIIDDGEHLQAPAIFEPIHHESIDQTSLGRLGSESG